MGWTDWNDFDKRMCGKWKCEELGNYNRYINIEFEDNENGAKVSYGSDSENCEYPAFYVEFSYGTLNWFHNDRYFREEYVMGIENDVNIMKCIYTQKIGNTKKEVEFLRLSAPPSEELIAKYKNMYTVAPKISERLDILKEYAEYGDIKNDMTFEYKFDERENVLDIIEKHKLDELVKGKNDVETAIALMNWLCGLYKHGNPAGMPDIRTPQSLMEFADKNEGSLNCRCLSLILAQLIRAYGIKAFHVTCMPYEQPFYDCHVVVCVYCESLGKYIMLDPSHNLYIKNKEGEIIGLEEFRDILINDEEMFFYEDYFAHLGNVNSYREYMSKNLIRIQRYDVCGYGKDCNWDDGYVTLIPQKYMQNEADNFDDDVKERFTSSREYFWQI